MASFIQSLCILLLSLSLATPVLAADATLNKIVAVVNGEMITLHDVRVRAATETARLQPGNPGVNVESMQKTVLDSMINDILLLQEGKRLKLTVDDSEVDNEVRKIVLRSRMSQQAFEAQLVRQGTSIAKLREDVKNNIIRQRITSLMVARKIVLPAGAVEEYYQAHKGEFQTEKSVDFSILIFGAGVKAENIYKELESGKLPFEEAARKYSVDSTAKHGGKVAGVPWRSLPPPMQQLFSTLRPGQLSPLVRSDKNLAVVRLDRMTEGHEAQSLEEARPLIESKLRDPLLQERYNEYVKDLRAKAVIDYRL